MAGKIITIDWELIASLPSDEYHIKLLNKQQSAVLLALCEYQHWTSRWDNLALSQQDLDRFMGDIEHRLMGDEDGMATVDDIRQGICEGLECALEKVAKRYLTGVTSGFEVDEDGEVIVGGDGADDVELPEDDPATLGINEEYAARTGGVRKVTDYIQEILTNMFTWYAGFTPPSTGVIEQQAATRLVNLYGFDETKATSFANYWYTVYQNSSGAVTLNEPNLDGRFFCKGVNLQSLAEYVYESHATAAEIPVLEVLIAKLDQSMLDAWYASGITVPSQDYYQYSCVPIESESHVLDFSTSNAPTRTTVQNLKQNHRYRFRVSGKFTDSDVPNIERDYFYKHDLSTGIKTFETPNAFNSTGIANVTASQIPYRSDGIYDVIVDKTGSASGCVFTRDNGADFNLPNVTGTITIIMEDLGEFAL